MMQGLGQKIVEWAVIASLVGIVGYLIGNSEATTMKLENDRQSADIVRLQKEVAELEALAPRVLTLEIEARSQSRKGDKQ
jgi:hypothetical protein